MCKVISTAIVNGRLTLVTAPRVIQVPVFYGDVKLGTIERQLA